MMNEFCVTASGPGFPHQPGATASTEVCLGGEMMGSGGDGGGGGGSRQARGEK
jgi:hypothetical protein